MSILDIPDNDNFLLGDSGIIALETDRPICSILASQALQSIQHKDLRYRSNDGYIWADWGKPELGVDGLEQRKFYVKALAELPNLVLRYMRRSGVNTKIGAPGKAQEELICKHLLSTYQIKAQWLEVFWLENESLLQTLKSDARKHLRCESYLSMCLYSLIQEVRAKAVLTDYERYQWVLHFDSPAQMWFSIEALFCLIHMTRKLSPGNEYAEINKEEYRLQVKELVYGFFEGDSKFEMEFSNNQEIGFIAPDDALDLIAKEMMSRKGDNDGIYISNVYSNWLKAWKMEENYKRKHKKLQSSYVDRSKRVVTSGR